MPVFWTCLNVFDGHFKIRRAGDPPGDRGPCARQPRVGALFRQGAPFAARANMVRLDEARRSAKLWRARSRLYRSQILQVNMRLKALVEIYTMHSFAQL